MGNEGMPWVGSRRLVLLRGRCPRAAVDLDGKDNEPRSHESECSSHASRGMTAKAGSESSYLVDPASSHMLVSKIKPCMSKYKQVCTVKLRMAH